VYLVTARTTTLRRREAASKIAEANRKAAASLKTQKELEDRIKTAEAKGEKRLQALREKMQSVSAFMLCNFISDLCYVFSIELC
jgi:molecular chaperone GrpE (heat shock protein)